MNKLQLVKAMANKSGLSIDICNKALKAFMQTVVETVHNKENIRLTRFGSFCAKAVAERKFVAPLTLKKITQPKKHVLKFYASSLIRTIK